MDGSAWGDGGRGIGRRPASGPAPVGVFDGRAALCFVAVTFGWSWLLIFGAVAVGGGAGDPLHLIGLLGPLLAWCATVGFRAGVAQRRQFLRRVFEVRGVGLSVWAWAAAVGAGPPLAAVGVRAMSDASPAVESLTLAGVIGAAGFAVAAGLAEEPGRRGVASEGAARAMGLLPSAVVLGSLWSLWHLPLYFLEGTYQYDLGRGTSEFWLSMVVRVPLAVLLVWLVDRAGGAVIAAVTAHALGNFAGELVADDLFVMVLQLVVMSAGASIAGVTMARVDDEERSRSRVRMGRH
jgi:uncharacterized protein